MAEGPQLRGALRAIVALEGEVARLRQREREPIALIGLSARTPFESHGVGIWEGLTKGIDASREYPTDRWTTDEETGSADKVVRRGNFLADVAQFDAGFFAIAPVEAQAMDPQQRIILETVWEALDHAALDLPRLQQMQTGVFLGATHYEYSELSFSADLPPAVRPYLATGGNQAIIAGRVSYALGLTGPSLVVDTACSSSLVALHLACESLRIGTSDIAIAGGVNLILSPRSTARIVSLGALSTDGRCRTFDASGKGFGRGEGCGVVVLKRMSDAVRDGDRILAVVRGSAINQDGRSDGLTAPSGLAQQRVVRAALDFAKISPSDVQYVETHGTGTVLGDPIEVEALGEVFGGSPRSTPLAIGSVKSNIGHLEGAAGISGVIKTVESIRHRTLVPNLHFETPNPHIAWEHLPLRVQTTLGAWPEPSKELIAGVSAFGFSGTNAHVVLGEPPAASKDGSSDEDRLAGEAKLLPLCVSAKTPSALREYAKRFADKLSAPLEAPATWRDVAFTSAVRRGHLEHRLVVVGSGPAEWVEKLAAFANGEARRGVTTSEAKESRRKVVFVFPGQGSQWLGMGRSLLESSPAFREHIERCEAAFRPHVSWSLLEELRASDATSRLKEIDVVQPLIFAIQTGLAAVWASFGVTPSAVVGHSMGEAAAAFVAGVLTIEDAAKVICVRSKLLRRVRGRGAMAALEMTMADAEAEIAKYGGQLSIAANNGARSTVVAGDTRAIVALVEDLKQRNVFCRQINVDVASHSPQVDELRDDLVRELAGLAPTEGTARFLSTCDVVGKPRLDAGYWWSNLREPVRLAQRLSELIASGHELFVEISPHPVLTMSVEESLRASGSQAPVVASLRRDESEAAVLLEAVGTLHCAGYPVSWDKVLGARGRVVDLPSYPWQRSRFWLPPERKAKRDGASRRWALVDAHVVSSDQPGKHVLQLELDLKNDAHAYLVDHKVQGGVWLPGAAILELALEAAAVAFEKRTVRVERVALSQALTIPEGEALLVQVVLAPEQDGVSPFKILSRPAKDGAAPWTEHASGSLAFVPASTPKEGAPLADLQKRCARKVEVESFYRDCAARMLAYGPAFKGIESLWTGESEALAKLVPTEKLTEYTAGYILHPAALDAAFQAVLVAAEKDMPADRTFVPSSVTSVTIFGRAAIGWGHVKVRTALADGIECDVGLFDEAGGHVGEVKGLRLVPLGRSGDKLDQWLFEQAWRPSVSKSPENVGGRWLILADSHGIAEGVRAWLDARGTEVVSVTRGTTFTKRDATRYELDPLEPGAIHRLMKEAFGKLAPRNIISLVGLDTRTSPEAALDEDTARRAEGLNCANTIQLAQAVTQMAWDEPSRLFVVTRACQAATASHDVKFPEQALAWGLGASLAHESPELRVTLIDLDVDTGAEALAHELAHADDETRVALRGKQRLVPRLVQHTRTKKGGGAPRPLQVSESEAYRLDPIEAGRAEGLGLQSTRVPTPGPGQVVIRTRASGINFRDVLITLGMYPGLGDGRPPMGTECAGVIHAVGERVGDLRPGDAVIASTIHCFDAYVLAQADQVVRKPASLSFEQAAALPSAVTTVLYALNRIGRLGKGERILIHAATGGVGLAAIQYARHVGARIYATAGSEEKRAYLRRLGIENVYDSRSLAWVDEIKRDTDGRGVDVVLNSLAGEALQKGLTVLAPFGRFIELGKRDIYANSSLGLYAIRNNIVVCAVALDQLMAERPAEFRALLEEAVHLVESGAFTPLPVESFPISRAAEAFDRLARAQHLGKVVLTAEEKVDVHDVGGSSDIRADRTYLITGGLGGIGLVVASRLGKLGAKHIALMGRNAPTDAAQRVIRELESAGVNVHVLRADVSDRAAVDHALAELAAKAPPVSGLVHSAGVLDDATIANLSVARISSVLAPKLRGTLVMDAALPDLELRVYFSSAANILGMAGQAHYAAANAFLDAFAHHRASTSSRALSLDWGAWSDVGMVTRADRIDNVTRQGLAMISPNDGAELFARALSSGAVQLAPLPIDIRQWRQANPQLAGLPFLREALAATAERVTEKNAGLFDRLRAASEGERVAIVEEYLRGTVARVLRSSPDGVPRTATFKRLGIDSLMTVSLKNTLERDLAIPISTATIFAHPSVERLALFVLGKLKPAVSPATQEAPAVKPALSPDPAPPPPTASTAEGLPSLDDTLSELVKGGYL